LTEGEQMHPGIFQQLAPDLDAVGEFQIKPERARQRLIGVFLLVAPPVSRR
jgi:hypothetical protein